METALKNDEKSGGKNRYKFMHKLNKQQTELWHHLVNFSQLFLFTEQVLKYAK